MKELDESETLDIYLDDAPDEVIEKVNEVLILYGLQFLDESEEDADFCTFRLVELDEVSVQEVPLD